CRPSRRSRSRVSRFSSSGRAFAELAWVPSAEGFPGAAELAGIERCEDARPVQPVGGKRLSEETEIRQRPVVRRQIPQPRPPVRAGGERPCQYPSPIGTELGPRRLALVLQRR